MRRIPIFLFSLSYLAAQPSASDLLRKVAQTYRDAKQFEFIVGITEMRPPQSGVAATSGLYEIAADGRGRMRFRATGSSANAWSGGMDAGELLTVADGENVWVVLSNQHQFKRQKGLPLPRDSRTVDDSIDNPRAFARKLMDSPFARYSKLASISTRKELAREEAIQVSGESLQCYVIEIEAESSDPDGRGSYTLWVDKKSNLVRRDNFILSYRRSVSYSNSILYTSATLNQPLSEGSFVFSPRNGSREVQSFFQ